MKKLIQSLLAISFVFSLNAFATTYTYTGNNYTIAIGQYTTAMRITGSIETSVPIPPDSTNFDIRSIASSWSFFDGLQTIDSSNGVFHPSFSTTTSTDASGNITRADIWVGDDPIGTQVNDTNNTIQTSFSTNYEAASIGAKCTGLTSGVCTLYNWGPSRGLRFDPPGTWVTEVDTYSVGGSITGLTGTIRLENNSGDFVIRNLNGDFTFSDEFADLAVYVVTVASQPTGQTCKIENASGTISGADVTNVSVKCTTDPIRAFVGTLPSGATGSLSFDTADNDCTFGTTPQFLPTDTVSPAPPMSVTPVDGVIQFTVDSCTPGATVTFSMDYDVSLPADASYWKAADPWFELPATVVGSIITFSITDGGVGDDDGLVNGQIVDPGGASIVDLDLVYRDGFESE